jgi:hypothetical protein
MPELKMLHDVNRKVFNFPYPTAGDGWILYGKSFILLLRNHESDITEEK